MPASFLRNRIRVSSDEMTVIFKSCCILLHRFANFFHYITPVFEKQAETPEGNFFEKFPSGVSQQLLQSPGSLFASVEIPDPFPTVRTTQIAFRIEDTPFVGHILDLARIP